MKVIHLTFKKTKYLWLTTSGMDENPIKAATPFQTYTFMGLLTYEDELNDEDPSMILVPLYRADSVDFKKAMEDIKEVYGNEDLYIIVCHAKRNEGECEELIGAVASQVPLVPLELRNDFENQPFPMTNISKNTLLMDLEGLKNGNIQA